jgi:hypothetical protein
MTRALVLSLALPLLGCVADQRQHLAKCISDAEREYPASIWVGEGARQQYVWLCMAAYGYRLNPRQMTCSGIPSNGDPVLYAQCYEPTKRISAFLQNLELALSRAPIKETRANGPRP